MLRNNGRHNFRSPFGIQPSLLLDFAGTGTLDSRVTFTRSTTATYYNSSGVLSTAAIDAPRFDYNPSTLAPLGLLIEQSSTNLCLYSEQFGNAIWDKLALSVTSNTIIAPDGTLNGDTLTTSGTSASQRIGQNVTGTGTLSNSFFVKAGTARYIQWLHSTDANAYINFDALLGVVGSKGSNASGTITSVGNGWYRCTATSTIASNNRFYLGLVVSNTASYAEIYTATVASLYVWGFQLEALAFSTSYIKTDNVQVIRASDNASMTGTNFSSWYTQGQGTVYAEYNSQKPSASSYGVFVISDNSPTNRYIIGNNIVGTRSEFYEINTSSNSIILASTTTASSFNKTAVSFVGSTISGSYNGSFVTGSATTMSATMTVLGIGYFYPGSPESNTLNGHIKKLSYYGSALTSAQLQALTT
jgi:hypothetical protein